MSDKRTLPTGPAPVRRLLSRAEMAARIPQAGLTPLEERVIRMRYGLSVPDDHPVGSPAVALDPVVRQALADMEAQALKMLVDQGRLQERDIAVAHFGALDD